MRGTMSEVVAGIRIPDNYVGGARKFFRHWYLWATHSRLHPMIEKARMLKTHLPTSSH